MGYTTRFNNKNRRAGARYGFVTELRYRAYRQTCIIGSGAGHTVNMSGGGVAIAIERVLEAGAEVEMVMDWPGIYHGRQRMRLFVWGEVLRSDERFTALRIVSHEFREAAPVRAVA